ncbi:IclR family transcriptional regulator [Maritalea sp.]|uniref:IclR family transcriptional regulator n=1 Tax=Maritalea sp. TaxID=2003361 RepID=UPI003EF153D7
MEVKADSQTGVALVAKAFQILDLFQLHAPSWSQAELIKTTGLNRSTVNRLVRFLASQGYLIHNGATSRYSLGLAAIELGNRAHANFDLRSTCQPHMEALSAQINETIILCAYDPTGLTGICIDQIEGRHQGLRVFERVGTKFPLHAGAAPKAILAFLPDDVANSAIDRKLEQLASGTIVSASVLRREILETREQGFAVSRQETIEGTTGLAAPIFGPQGSVIGSVGVSIPVPRESPETMALISSQLMGCTKAITKTLAGENNA